MILPIVAYGASVLTKKGVEIQKGHSNFEELVENMFETMYAAKGVGLAAPQIDESLQLFIVDSEAFIHSEYDDEEDMEEAAEEPIKRVFINPEITKLSEETSTYNEGCLSIPDIRNDITRPENIEIRYLDEKFEEQTESFFGINARIVQHEFDRGPRTDLSLD